MLIPYSFFVRHWPWQAVLLSLLLAQQGRAQQFNTGALYTGPGMSWAHYEQFTNAATGSIVTEGSTVTYAGPSVRTFSNSGTYLARNNATAIFPGPNALGGGSVELAGTVRPTFCNATFTLGGNILVTNTRGVAVAGLANLGSTQLIITDYSYGDAAGLHFLAGSSYSYDPGLSANNSHAFGYVTKVGDTPFVLPVGSSSDYRPLSLTSLAGGGPTSALFTAYFETDPNATADPTDNGETHSTALANLGPGLAQVLRAGFWDFGLRNATSADVTVSLPDVSAFATASQLRLVGWNGTQWVNLSGSTGASGTAKGSTLAGTAPANIKALALGVIPAPLPVVLLSFTAAKQEANGLVSWSTASEQSSAYFDVQASPDGQAWQTLCSLPAAGHSLTAHRYSYVDKTITRYGSPLVYYRLRQVDLDGTATFSPVATLTPDAPAWAVTAYPNPYAQDLSTQFTSSEPGPVTLTLLDGAGRVVLRQQVAGTPGTQVIVLDQAKNLAPGAYVLLVRQNKHAATVRVVHN